MIENAIQVDGILMYFVMVTNELYQIIFVLNLFSSCIDQIEARLGNLYQRYLRIVTQ